MQNLLKAGLTKAIEKKKKGESLDVSQIYPILPGSNKFIVAQWHGKPKESSVCRREDKCFPEKIH
jgi:hypothetical protein